MCEWKELKDRVNVACASSISQYAAIEAMTNGAFDVLPMKEATVQRRDFCVRQHAVGNGL